MPLVRRGLATAAGLLAGATLARAAVVPVSDVAGLTSAIQNAAAGDEIVLAPGTYDVPTNLTGAAAGTALAPIRVRAGTAHTALLRFGGSGGVVEGFRISGPHWRLEDLDIEGVCPVDGDCEHAIHVFGDAEFLVVRNNRIRNFNAQIKSNGIPGPGGPYVFPDDARIERNVLYDTHVRNTDHPVTKLDVVGGRRWIVRANTIYDYVKGGGDGVSYAAFLKGNSRDGLFERNLVICRQALAGGVGIGLSLGGGGTVPAFCEGGDCTYEHQNGTLRNNLILACNDVGIYLNRASNTRVEHNTLYDTTGIDVRFPTASADARNNLTNGLIRTRDGASLSQSGNLASVPLASFDAWFEEPAAADFRLLDGSQIVDLGAAAAVTTDDFCANDRDDGMPDIGALEFDADFGCLTNVGGGTDLIFADGFD
jgi:parallel beta-helix repeat protein